MFTYEYHITIHGIIHDNRVDIPFTLPVTGTVQAECYSAACTMAWQAINAACTAIRLDTGKQVYTSDFRLDRMQEAPEVVQEAASEPEPGLESVDE